MAAYANTVVQMRVVPGGLTTFSRPFVVGSKTTVNVAVFTDDDTIADITGLQGFSLKIFDVDRGTLLISATDADDTANTVTPSQWYDSGTPQLQFTWTGEDGNIAWASNKEVESLHWVLTASTDGTEANRIVLGRGDCTWYDTAISGGSPVPIESYYTKTESDARYYTQAQADAKFLQVADTFDRWSYRTGGGTPLSGEFTLASWGGGSTTLKINDTAESGESGQLLFDRLNVGDCLVFRAVNAGATYYLNCYVSAATTDNGGWRTVPVSVLEGSEPSDDTEMVLHLFALGSRTSDYVTNASGVTGSSVSAALDTLDTTLSPFLTAGVMRISESGARTFYEAASDTDQARGLALETAVGAHAAGDVLIVGPGVYEVDYTLQLKSQVTLAGSGMFATVIKQSWLGSAIGTASVRAHSTIINENFDSASAYGGASDIELRDFTVTGRSSCIGFGHCENIVARNIYCNSICLSSENGHFFDLCAVKNFRGHNLVCEAGCEGYGVFQVDAAGVNTALQALDTDGTTELLVNVDSTACIDVQFHDCYSEILGSAAVPDNMVHYAIHRDGHDGILISNCHARLGRFFVDTDDGIESVSNLHIKDSHFASTDTTTQKPPIRLRSSNTNRMQSVLISGLTLEFATTYGIFLRRINDFVVTGCSLRATSTNASIGILCYGSRGVISGNILTTDNDPYVATSEAIFADESPTDATSNELEISNNVISYWDRGIDNQDAAADIKYGPNVFKGVNEEIRAGSGSPAQVTPVPFNNRHATMYISTPAATTVASTSTWYKAAGTTTSRNLSSDFTMPSDNRLQYNGVHPIHAHVAVTIALTTGTAGQVIYLRAVKNGDETLADAVASEVSHKTGTGGDVISTAVHYDTMMSNGDYLELFIRNSTGTNNVTLEQMYFFILGMLSDS